MAPGAGPLQNFFPGAVLEDVLEDVFGIANIAGGMMRRRFGEEKFTSQVTFDPTNSGAGGGNSGAVGLAELSWEGHARVGGVEGEGRAPSPRARAPGLGPECRAPGPG